MIAYCLKHTQLFSLFFTFLAFFFFVTTNVSAAMNYGSGTYTNLCGSGTSATFHTCSGECNPATGSCASKSGNTIVKYVCDGRHNECRDNESAFSTYHSIGSVACGKTVQIDVFRQNCRDGNGNWTCNDSSLTDYMVWYSGDCSTPPAPPATNTCQEFQPVDTQFRLSGSTAGWVDGNALSQLSAKSNRIDVNCFAKNGSTLLPGARIIVKEPNGTEKTLSTTGSAYRYSLEQSGNYEFRCESTTLANCANTDRVTVTLTDRPDVHQAACEDLTVASGNNQTVPAKVTLRARATDNLGNIQKYRFYFGDGQHIESDSAEVQHTYEISGNFIARADVKNSKGVWITGEQCEARVNVKPARLETHKSNCSDVFITAGNHEKAPIAAKFKVTGYDNKGDIKKYKLDFGNGIEKESDSNRFEQLYDKPGTYTIKGYVQDSSGDWKGGSNNCKTTLYIETARVTKQPDTGTPTNFTVAAILSGVIGSVLLMRRSALLRR